MRKPLIEIEELHRFAAKVKGEMWGKQFYEAARQVMGIAASPLEVAGINVAKSSEAYWRSGV